MTTAVGPASLTLTIRVNDVDRILERFNFVSVWTTTDLNDTGNPINFTELTTPATRIALVSGSAEYVFVDPNGTEDTWYAIGYYNSDTSAVSGLGSPVKGIIDPALELLTVDQLKNIFLFGIDLTNDFGEPYPDELFQFYIRSAVQFVRDKLDIDLLPTEQADEKHDFYKRDYEKYVITKLDRVPVIEVTGARLVLPLNQKIIDYSPNSFQVDHDAGWLEIVPGSGQILLGQTGAFLPLVFGGQDYLPQAIRVDYTSGFRNGFVPADIQEVIGMLASFGPLGIAGDLLVGAGIASQSLSIDGLSQSVNTTSSATNSGYGARLVQYQKQLKDMWQTLRARYHPKNLLVA